MPIINSKTGQTRRSYTVEDLKKAAAEMRGYDMIALACAGSGHSGGTLSAMDFTAALYLHEARIDPQNPSWPERDRILWSTGHKAPNAYIGPGMAGAFDLKEVATLRRLGSRFQGHPHWLKFPWAEASTGSLGQGLSVGVGICLAAKLDGAGYRTYVMCGDGELQEGQIWEAAMSAGHYKLDNLCCIVDKNRLQIDGWVKDVMNIDPLPEKFASFGWHVIEIDGHKMEEILKAFDEAKAVKGKPTVIIGHTVKGHGCCKMENVAGWHGKSPSRKEMEEALSELGVTHLPANEMFEIAKTFQEKADKTLAAKQPKFSRDYFWNTGKGMSVEMKATRMGFGKALQEKGDDQRIVCLGADISGSITISQFYEKNPERKPRFLSMGIAEQNATSVAAGLAKEGKIPVFGTYGVFASGRNLDQLRTTVAYGHFNVLIVGAHGGVSVGPDGATHQALEDLFNVCGIPGMTVVVPCDYEETRKATVGLLFDVVGPKYIRFAREATPMVTREGTPFVMGKANVIWLRKTDAPFIDCFEHVLAESCRNEKEDLSIIACGPEVPEAMRTAWILKEEYGLETRVINMHTVRPLDADAIIRAARETGCIVTAEEHQVGGLADRVASIILSQPDAAAKAIPFGRIGVLDRFGESGAPWELIKEFQVSGEHIAAEAKRCHDQKPKKPAKRTRK